MAVHMRAAARLVGDVMQRAAFVGILGLAVAMAAYTLASAVGAAPWLGLHLDIGGAPLPEAGRWVQIGVTAFLALLLFFLPANARMLALETSHRRFDMDMRDVVRAYHVAHAADRASAFRLVSEFDAVKERLAFLRRHPDLDRLEPEILDLAAKMSFSSRDLARIYTEEKVERARLFLRQRQEEIATFADRLKDARAVVEDLGAHVEELDRMESMARQDLARLRADLRALLPELFEHNDEAPPPATVTPMRRRLAGMDAAQAE